MEKEFVPYELAVKLKELGFDEPCFMTYLNGKLDKELFLFNHSIRSHSTQEFTSAPLFQQTFRWFREKQAIEGFIHKAIEGTYYFVIKRLGNNESNMYEFITNAPKNVDTFEEAEQECLKKLIELIEPKSE